MKRRVSEVFPVRVSPRSMTRVVERSRHLGVVSPRVFEKRALHMVKE